MKIQVNLHESTNPDGWCASIARVNAPKGAKIEISMGESEIYTSKEAAWGSIQKNAEKLDYENDEIKLNLKKVKDYADLKSKVDAL